MKTPAHHHAVTRPDFTTMSDDEVVLYSQTTADDEAISYIVHKYRNLVRAKARAYYLVGADKEDIIQEGMIGLYKATRDFRPEHNASFAGFADLCITRQIITAIKTATRQKHMPLNSYISLQKPIREDNQDRMLIDIFMEGTVMSPEELFIGREDYSAMEAHLGERLTDLEWEVLVSYLEGKTYQEMAVSLARDLKSIDNALQRIKRKIEKYLLKRKQKELEPKREVE